VPFQAPTTIAKALESIHRHEYVLPAIQREFVWDTDQICMLFDSLMRGYPFGSFLFWKVKPENSGKYVFYDFVREYHERDSPHCPTLDVPPSTGVTATLDGQQRLTALNIGLRGSHAEKLPNKWKANAQAYPKKFLYLNLRREPADRELNLRYDFKFLTKQKAEEDVSPDAHWFKVSEILSMTSGPALFKYVQKASLADHPTAYEVLDRLHNVIHRDLLINFFEEEDQDLDKVLNIFIRVNSGGTVLSYADLLLSIATAQWKGRDARQEVFDLVDQINEPGHGFDFPKDLVLKAALVLADIPDVAFKVTNFNTENMAKIEARWDSIAHSLRLGSQLLADFGFSQKTLSANNVLIPIAYYLMVRGAKENYLTSVGEGDDRERVRTWTVRSLVKAGVWGSGLDTLLRALRDVLTTEAQSGFPLAAVETAMSKLGKSLRIDEEELTALLESEYGHRGTFAILSLLYPGHDLRNEFHEDHVFPKSMFKRKQLLAAGVPSDDVDGIMERVNLLPNLQLLEGPYNVQKSAKPPHLWMAAQFPSMVDRNAYTSKHDLGEIPTNIKDFPEFFEARRGRLAERLRKLLNVVPSGAASED
jgi:hypothetical protein